MLASSLPSLSLSSPSSQFERSPRLQHKMIPQVHDANCPRRDHQQELLASLVVWLGANDTALPDGSSSESHVPVQEYQDNLRLDFNLQPPPPVFCPSHHRTSTTQVNTATRSRFTAPRKFWLPIIYSSAMAGKYARVETAGKTNMLVLGLHTYFNNLPESERHEDGLHASVTGNTLMYQQFREAIDSELPDVSIKPNQWQFLSYENFVETNPWSRIHGRSSTLLLKLNYPTGNTIANMLPVSPRSPTRQ